MATNKRFLAKNGVDNNNNTLSNVSDPVNAQDASTKAFSSNASNLTSGTVDNARLPSTITATITGNASTATTLQTARNINEVPFNGSSNITISRVRAVDNRIAAPEDFVTQYATVGFGSWNNNNTSPYADYITFRTYSDPSGGNDNMVSFRKNAIGMRIWQQTYGSATDFTTYKDVAFTDSNITGSAATLTTSRTIWGQSFNGSANVTGSLTSVGDITGTGAVTLTATAGTLNLSATGANVITASTNGSERMRITSSGNMLIGGTSDDGNHKLQVTGSLAVGNSSVTNAGVLMSRTSSSIQARMHSLIPSANSPTYQNVFGGMWTGERAGSTDASHAYYTVASPAGVQFEIGRIGTSGSFTTSNMTPAIVIKGVNDFVGLGTTSPDGKLHLSGTSSAPAALIFERSDGGVGAKNWFQRIRSNHTFDIGKTDDSGTVTNTYFSIDTNGAVNIPGALTVGNNLTVNGTTTTVNSTTVTIDDPIFTLGGDTAPGTDDNKDRGIEFRWHNGTSAKVGFFGFDDSTGKFTFIPDATNTSEVFSGTKGTLDANIAWSDVTGTPTTLSGYGITDAASSSHTHTQISNGTSNVNIASSNGDITVARAGSTQATFGASMFTVNNNTTISNSSARLYVDAAGGSPQVQWLRSSVLDALIGTSSATDNTIAGSTAGDLCVRTVSTDVLFSTDNGSTSMMTLTSGGQVLVGKTTSRAIGGVIADVQIEAVDSSASLAICRNSNDASSSYILLSKTRGTTVGSNTLVQDGDVLGAIQFSGGDGTDTSSAGGAIQCRVDGTAALDNMPGRLVFSTTSPGSNFPTERMVIKNTGDIGIGTSAPSARLHARVVSNTASEIARFENINTGLTDNAYVRILADNVNNLISYDSTGTSSGAHAWLTGNTERMRLTATGNLLIGTTTDNGGVLQVNGTAWIFGNILRVGPAVATPGNGGNIRFHDDTGTSRWLTGILGSAGAKDYSIRDIVGGVDRVYIPFATGNVLIGTTTDNGSKAQIQGNNDVTSIGGTSTLDLLGGDTNNDFCNFSMSTSAAGRIVTLGAKATTTGAYPNVVGELHVGVQNGASTTTTAVFTGSGNVLIGSTTQPTGVRLYVNGGPQRITQSGGAYAFVEDSAVADGNRPFGYIANVGGVVSIGNANRSGTATTGSANRINIATDGKVAIGTTADTAQLKVTSSAVNVPAELINGLYVYTWAAAKPSSTAVTITFTANSYFNGKLTFMYCHTNGGNSNSAFSEGFFTYNSSTGAWLETVSNNLTTTGTGSITFATNDTNKTLTITMPAGNGSSGYYSFKMESLVALNTITVA